MTEYRQEIISLVKLSLPKVLVIFRCFHSLELIELIHLLESLYLKPLSCCELKGSSRKH